MARRVRRVGVAGGPERTRRDAYWQDQLGDLDPSRGLVVVQTHDCENYWGKPRGGVTVTVSTADADTTSYAFDGVDVHPGAETLEGTGVMVFVGVPPGSVQVSSAVGSTAIGTASLCVRPGAVSTVWLPPTP